MEDKLLESQAVLLKGPAHRLTWTHSLWAPVWGQQVERHHRPMGRNRIVQHQGESWGQLSPRKKCWQRPLFLFWALPLTPTTAWPLWAPPSPAQVAAISRKLCSSCCVSPRQNTVGGWPWMCQQHSRLSCHRRVYTAHMVGAPWVPSLGDRRGCATELYRASTTLGHPTKPGKRSSSTKYIETNTRRLPKWGDKEACPKWKNRTKL